MKSLNILLNVFRRPRTFSEEEKKEFLELIKTRETPRFRYFCYSIAGLKNGKVVTCAGFMNVVLERDLDIAIGEVIADSFLGPEWSQITFSKCELPFADVIRHDNIPTGVTHTQKEIHAS